MLVMHYYLNVIVDIAFSMDEPYFICEFSGRSYISAWLTSLIAYENITLDNVQADISTTAAIPPSYLDMLE